MENRGRRFTRYRARAAGGYRDPASRCIPVANVVPDAQSINLRVLTVSSPRLIQEASQHRLWEVVVGDETGVVTLHIDERSSNIAQALKAGISIWVRNCEVKMLNDKFLTVVQGRWGKIDVSPMKHFLTPKLDTNISAYEYKYVQDD
jgi:hypothetical protein